MSIEKFLTQEKAEIAQLASQLDELENILKLSKTDAALLGASLLPPPAGTAADIASLGVSLGRGDWGGAFWDLIGIVPIVGDTAKALAKGSKLTAKIADISRAIEKGRKKLAKKTKNAHKKAEERCRKQRQDRSRRKSDEDAARNCNTGDCGVKNTYSSLDELNTLRGTGKNVGDLSGISGAKIEDIISNIPENATVRKLKPVEGKSQKGLEYKWTDENGITNRLRIHDPDPSHPGSNSANGWVARWQQKGGYYDPTTGKFAHKNAHKSNSPFHDPAAANNTHIPVQTPDNPLTNLMKMTPEG